MAKLVVSYEGVVEGHYFLDKAQFTIGRNPENDLCLNSLAVSNVHAVILTMTNDHVLEDAASTNGLLVNAKGITKHILQNNDVIELSGYQLKYINQRATSDMDFDKTMISNEVFLEGPGVQGPGALPVKPLLATATLSARAVKNNFPLGGVINMQGPNSGEKILISAPLKTFGQPGKQVVMISRRPHGYYATHVEGKAYPKVNGKTIGTQACPLQENDLIEAAEVKLRFFMPTSESVA